MLIHSDMYDASTMRQYCSPESRGEKRVRERRVHFWQRTETSGLLAFGLLLRETVFVVG